MQGGCRADARARRTDEQVSELAQALERRGPLRPLRVGRVEGRCDGTVVRDVDGGVGEEVKRACGLTGLLAAERRQVELRLRAWVHAWAQAQLQGVHGSRMRCGGMGCGGMGCGGGCARGEGVVRGGKGLQGAVGGCRGVSACESVLPTQHVKTRGASASSPADEAIEPFAASLPLSSAPIVCIGEGKSESACRLEKRSSSRASTCSTHTHTQCNTAVRVAY